MGNTDYTYQITAANKVLQNAFSKRFKASILAVAPGGGKTTISHHIINKYVSINPSAKILVLTEGQNTLKNQYLQELESPNIEMNVSFGHLNNTDAQVRVGIPQSIGQLDWTSVDLLIVDEAHNFYLEPMVQDIIKKLQPKHQILMTGSPTKYNAINEKAQEYAMYYISAEELTEKGVYNSVDFDVAKTNPKNPVEAYKAVAAKAKANRDNMSKLMIACPTIAYAKTLATYLQTQGRKVSLSTSKNDPDDVEIAKFKANESDTLIVVGKGILGFNDSYITTLIDMRSSSNVDASFQLFARVLRKHPQGVRKTYYRIADGKNYNRQVLFLHKMVALMKKEIYTQYNGNNLRLDVA